MASTNDHRTPDPQVEARSTGPRRYTAEYKTRILAEYETLGIARNCRAESAV
ncbi:hypothetical protein ACWEP4_36095 [Streptomyces sp. NPDC004227]